MTDFALQRKNMVESQVRPSDITDRRIIRAMGQVPRERFVPEASRSIAYRDEAIQLSAAKAGQPARHLLSGRTLAALIQMMDLGDQDRALIIGAGSGYSAAVLSTIAASVIGLECDGALAALAARETSMLEPAATLASANAPQSHVNIVTGPLTAGHATGAPYDAILIEGAVTAVPTALLDQLKDGGRLVAIQIEQGVGRASQWRRSGSTFASRAVRDMNATVLPGFEARPSFVF